MPIRSVLALTLPLLLLRITYINFISVQCSTNKLLIPSCKQLFVSA